MYSRAWASSLRYRDFRLFWASTLFYSLGTGMEHVAVGWLVFDITDSAFLVGVTAAARMALSSIGKSLCHRYLNNDAKSFAEPHS